MQFALPRKYRRIFVSRVFPAFYDAGVEHIFVFFCLQLHSWRGSKILPIFPPKTRNFYRKPKMELGSTNKTKDKPKIVGTL